MIEDEDLLMAVLNSAPNVDGVPIDHLDDPTEDQLAAQFGGRGTETERLRLQYARGALQAVIRGETAAAERLTPILNEVALLPEATAEGLQWRLEAPADERLAARMILAWSRVAQRLPGRLRPCANTECNLFLIDHSRPGTAKWCSMATCGNRMKVRAHARRARRS
ncbi:CGNR zinc finger domain-containing protein [Aeromicrobium sp. CTD01-1L150]|uniref:CGNR zinc finger domain-containing protein n=1 Tax=Aeromicrobium sp. CTD01-1L150 TaxID=3341830 RepID=UPI0035C087C2